MAFTRTVVFPIPEAAGERKQSVAAISAVSCWLCSIGAFCLSLNASSKPLGF